jgi:hypothetical protein
VFPTEFEPAIPASERPQTHALDRLWDQLCSQYKCVCTDVGHVSQVTCSPLYSNGLSVLQTVSRSAAELSQDGYNINHSAADHGGAKDKRGREIEDDRFAVTMRPVSVAGCHETISASTRRTRSALCSPFYVGTSSPHRGSTKKQRKEIFRYASQCGQEPQQSLTPTQ